MKPVKKRKNTVSKADLENLYEKTKKELDLLSGITNSMMQSLNLNEVLNTVLTSLISSEILDFDRAAFFLVDENTNTLEGKMALEKNAVQSKLNDTIKDIHLPLNENGGILSKTILEGASFAVDPEDENSAIDVAIMRVLETQKFVTVPLIAKDQILGALFVDNKFSEKDITPDNFRILNLLADHAALAIENSKLYKETMHLSSTDWLTGLWNPRYFNGVLDEIFRIANRKNSSISLIMVDIDNFKKYNDSLGHPAGDKAIAKIAHIINSFSRKSDFACRYGGEEFCTVMLETPRETAVIIAERLRREVEKAFQDDNSIPKENKLTISLGVASFPDDGNDKEDLIKKADMALYDAKTQGKNRTCTYP